MHRTFVRGFRQRPSMVVKSSIMRRGYKVLAIESSCDDSCIALLESPSPRASSPSSSFPEPIIIDQVKSTLNSTAVGGIIPTSAHEHHQKALSQLLQDFLAKHDNVKPDLVCCTRGPGMVGSLSAGLQLAKGLSVAWSVPLIGVHHMLGHILIATLPQQAPSSIAASSTENAPQPPQYPFLSLLCSGGHTMLVLSKSLTDHQIVINTADIAAGDSLDKCGRELGFEGIMIGKELESYIDTSIPKHLKEEFQKENTSESHFNKYNFRLRLPLRKSKHNQTNKTNGDVVQDPKSEPLVFSFAGFLSSIQTYKRKAQQEALDEQTVKFIAYKTQERLFDHIVDRIQVAFERHADIDKGGDGLFTGVNDFILSGGVAANKRLREKLRVLNNSGGGPINFQFPSLDLCTDNAIMIGVAGIHIFEELRLKSDLSVLPIRKWPLNELTTIEGWNSVDDAEYHSVVEGEA